MLCYVIHYTILYHTVLYCTILYYTIRYCFLLCVYVYIYIYIYLYMFSASTQFQIRHSYADANRPRQLGQWGNLPQAHGCDRIGDYPYHLDGRTTVEVLFKKRTN